MSDVKKLLQQIDEKLEFSSYGHTFWDAKSGRG